MQSQGTLIAVLWLVLSLAAAGIGAQTTTVFQSGPGQSESAPGFGRATATRFTGSAQSTTAWTTEGPEMYIRDFPGMGVLDFPNLVGPGAGQIPPGAQIVSATLELYCTRVVGPLFPSAISTVTPEAILDPDLLGPWHEPEQNLTQAFRAGVNYAQRDAREGRQRDWDLSGNVRATTNATVSDPLLPASTNPNVRINIASPRVAGTVRGGETHAFDVTDHVRYWVRQGRSNQGWLLRGTGPHDIWYATEEPGGSASRAPRLIVQWNPGSAPSNHVPDPGVTAPPVLQVVAGADLAFFISPTDVDAATQGAPEIVVSSPPRHGRLVRMADLPVWNYRADADFSGVDEFTYFVRDGVSTSRLQRVPITVVRPSGLRDATFQPGLSPGNQIAAGDVRQAGTLAAPQVAGFGTTVRDARSRIGSATPTNFGRQSFLEFSNLIGGGAGQIAPGSRIVSARLDLKLDGANHLVPEERLLVARRVLDPLATGTGWHLPAAFTAASGAAAIGVTFLHRDERSAPAGAWEIPGGNGHPGEAASAVIDPSFLLGDIVSLDVTRSVQAWASGAPNQGWRVGAEGLWAGSHSFHSADAPTPADRPRLVVTWLPPGAPAPTTLAVAPRADAGPDQEVFTGEVVTLDARGTNVPLQAGEPAAALIWVQAAGPPVGLFEPTTATPRFLAPTTPTRIEFLLAAISSSGAFSADRVVIDVNPQPGGGAQPPIVVDAGPDRSGTELTRLTLNAQLLLRGSGTVTTRWTQLSGPTVSSPAGLDSLSPSFQLPAVGASGARIVFDCTVEEVHASGYLAVHRDEVVIDVLNFANRPPVARIAAVPRQEEGSWVVLDASTSSDPENQPLDFTWRQLQGPSIDVNRYVTPGTAEAVRNPIRIPSLTGPTVFSFEVTASDRELTDTATVTFTADPLAPSFTGSFGSTPLAPYRDQLTPEEARHLLRRLGAGWSPSDVAMVRSAGLGMTVDAAIAQSFNLPGGGTYHTPDRVTEEAFTYAPLAYRAMPRVPYFQQPGADIYPQLLPQQGSAAWLVMTVRNPNFLRARMAGFWSRRLSVSPRDLPAGQQQAIIPHVMGRFDSAYGNLSDILIDFIRDPVTLSFIDGFENLRFAPNENFGREFLELYTIGVFDRNGVPLFTQGDVTDAARAFTGWRPVQVRLDQSLPPSWYPGYVPFFHDGGMKTVLGVTGAHDEVDMVDIVLQDFQGGMAAARSLAENLLWHFVTDEPPASLVENVATLILNEGWELEPVVRRILKSRAMFAPEAEFAIMKSPIELLNGIARTIDVPLQTGDLVSYSELAFTLREAGEEAINPLDVDGWPRGEEWISDEGLLQRFNIAARLMQFADQPSLPGPSDQPGNPTTRFDPRGEWLPPVGARFSEETVAFVAERLGVPLSRTAFSGASRSEFDLVRDFMDQESIRPPGAPLGTFSLRPRPFDGDDPTHEAKLFALFVLLMEHPYFQRL